MLDHVPRDRRARILIIDDNKSIHEDVRKILSGRAPEEAELDAEAAAIFGLEVQPTREVQYHIDSAFQGQEGLGMVEAAAQSGDPYAMAFVDVRMPPGWDGVETVRRIWQRHPELQIVVCTAYSDYSWEDMMQKVGKTDSLFILKKPFDNIEVVQLAHTLTQKWEMAQKLRTQVAGLDALVAERTQDLQTTNSRLQKEMADRLRMERELSRSEERFAKAFQASPCPMAIQSLHSERLLDANPAFSKLTGRSWDELIGSTPSDLMLAEQPELQAALEELRSTGSLQNAEWRVVLPDGGTRDCLLSGETYELDGERVALITALDVSQQRRLEAQLRQSQKMEAIGQLAAGVAHDFNNILTIIQGHATMQMVAPNNTPEQAHAMKQISYAADRATALTRQLLTFSRKQVVQQKALRVNEVMRDLHAMLKRLIGEHIALQCDYCPLEPVVFADETNLEQIVINVVVNARDAMPDGGRLHMGTETVEVDAAHVRRQPAARPGTYVRLIFKDSGCGMSEDTLTHLFEPFFTTKAPGRGTGLGLATVYGIVAQHGGWIEVTSRLGEGTCFQIYLPTCEEEVAPAPSLTLDVLRGGHETILLVEDEADVREIVTGILAYHGYEVVCASDAVEALEIWERRKEEIALLVTDVNLPNGMRGNALAARLREERPELRVVFSTGYSPEASEVNDFGDAVVLQKPYKLEGLVSVVRESLDARA